MSDNGDDTEGWQTLLEPPPESERRQMEQAFVNGQAELGVLEIRSGWSKKTLEPQFSRHKGVWDRTCRSTT